MSTPVATHHGGNGVVAVDDPVGWRSQTRVFLTPIAAPSILGLFGFAGATFMVAANLDGWFGSPASNVYLFPFLLTFGGIAQFTAAMWAYRARDGIATAMHGLWGSFWIAYGILWGFAAAGAFKIPFPLAPAMGYWFIVLGTITFMGFLAACFENLGLASVLFTLAIGSVLLVPSFLLGASAHVWLDAGAWSLLISSFLAVYTATAMMLEGAAGRVVLPLGHLNKRGNVPGETEHIPLQFELGEPGVRRGQ